MVVRTPLWGSKSDGMDLTGNTVLITGGGSGIGASLASAFHRLGNTVIVAGRRAGALAAMVASHPGMAAIELDVTDPESVKRAVAVVVRDHPSLNVLINNAGIVSGDDPGSLIDEASMTAEVETNFLGPIRLTSALMAHLRRQPRAHLVYVTSFAGFTPVALYSVFSATKAALHSYVLSQRFALKDTRVTVQEIIPPWVATGFVGATDHVLAMPLEAFIAQTMADLATDALESVATEGSACRNNPGRREHAYIEKFNTFLLAQSF
jgi:uncharacterized oxidoreductase